MVLVGCSTKNTCPKPIDTFTIYERPEPLHLSGSKTVEDLTAALKAVAIKSRVQEELLKQYENDIKRFRSLNGN